MNEMITWNETECDSVNGYGMQVHYSFTSFDKSEIDKIKKWCESHIQAGVKLENLTFKKESVDVLDKIRAEIEAKIVKRPWLNFEDRERDRNDAFLEVLDIIDKHRKGNEE